MQNTVHFILQGKGGVGKSFIAALLAQYFRDRGAALAAFDTDQENTTFAHYKALAVRHVPVMTEARTIDPKRFDHLIEQILAEDATFVVDNGANTFSPLLAYMVENSIAEFLSDSGKRVFVHTIVGGGDTLVDTAKGLKSIAEGLELVPLVLWLNAHFGDLTTTDGKEFVDTPLFARQQERMRGVVVLKERNPQTFGDDIRKMNIARLTVQEVMGSTDFTVMEKQRIRMVAADVYRQLEKIEF